MQGIVQVVEIDIDYCTRTFGVSPCMASLGPDTPRKCYNTFKTCAYRQAYNKGSYTLRFVSEGFPVRTGGKYYPCLTSVSGREQEVNISGFRDKVSGLGQRASITVNFDDFPDNDSGVDKYSTERRSGAAQVDESGYDPGARGSFWTKFKARNPNYSGRPLRVVDSNITSGGALQAIRTRHYIITDIEGPDASGRVTVRAKDVLALAEDKKALAPRASRGRISTDMTSTQTSVTLTPAGIGAEYPSGGSIVIGSEIMGYTRSGDVLTVIRGLLGTSAASHTVNDSVQLTFWARNERADSVIRNLLVNYANIPSSYIPFSEWQAEFDRWGGSLLLHATICKPTSVSELLSEIGELGITLWWDEVARLIRLRLTHPNEETPTSINDINNIISASTQDNDSERATRVSFWTVQIDPTKELNKDNFQRSYINIALAEEGPDFYNQVITKTIYCRWLNQGADNTAKIIAGRLLNRYRSAPVTYNFTVDAKDDIKLVDVVNLNSYVVTDDTGRIVPKLTQVYYRKDDFLKGTIDLRAQAFEYVGRYGGFTENSRPVYGSSTTAQKNRGTYWVGPTLQFADGRQAYQFA